MNEKASTNAPVGVRRVVTGHNAQGQAVIQSDGPTPTLIVNQALPGLIYHELWEMSAVPAPIPPEEKEPTDHPLVLAPPRGGVRIRFNDIPPEGEHTSPETAKKVFESIGAKSAHHGDGKHVFMHKTETVDFAIVMEGEIYLIVDEGETLIKTGEVVIQRGTNHSWANRSGKNCRLAFILVDGQFEGPLAHR